MLAGCGEWGCQPGADRALTWMRRMSHLIDRVVVAKFTVHHDFLSIDPEMEAS
jgi:hypothetical protein